MAKASRGSVRLRTAKGRGTAFIMTFPISTAIIDGLVVKVGVTTLIVPASAVVELLKVKDGQLSSVSGEVELITLREKVMPVLRLGRVLGIGTEGGSTTPIGLVVENSDQLPHFLVIDEVVAKREVVVKPLGPKFRDMRGITAGTVLPGGAIGLVLDVDQLVSLAIQMGKAVPARAGEETAWK
jgi:two-component system chemotaxis sensor kinase CheA